uniref:Seminal fluid protein n=1 Tax=Drosophila melanogaster TaxID=7227 RepID=A0A6M3Q719_DROME|nr:uncharacterized protein Dmel_CG46412 [Drosophila melanogaster]QJC18615.1 uncharacterized protein Dmel_CG46412 [Drosophila melanogaster]
MEPFPKFVIIFLAAFINVAYGMHNPMMRDNCNLGEHLTCRLKFIHCWLYACVCLPNHSYLGLGNGCLHIRYA